MIILRLKPILAGLILGWLIGAASVSLLAGKNLDKAELEIRNLHIQLEDQTEQLADMDKKLTAAKRNMLVSDIDVHVDFPDEYERLEIETAVKKLLKSLRSREVSSLDPALVANIIDRRILEVSEHKYHLTVKGTMVSEKIIVYVEAKEITDFSL